MVKILNCNRDLQSPAIGEVIFKNGQYLNQDRILLNIDTLKLFKENGSDVVLSESEKKCKYSWRFSLDKPEFQDEKAIKIDGEMPGIGSFGDLFDNKSQPSVTLTQLQICNQSAQEWISSMDFNLKWRKEWAQERIRIATTWNASLSVYKIPERMHHGAKFYSLLAIFDDSMDTAKTFENSWGHPKSPEKWAQTCGILCSILDGTLTLDNIPDTENAPLFKPTCKAFAYFRNLAIEFCGVSEANIFANTMREYIESTGLESMLDYPQGLSEVGYDLIRTKSAGAEVCVNFMCLMNNLKLTPTIRKSSVFELLNKLFAIQFFLVNDLISWVKELKEDTPNNTVLLRSKKTDISSAYQSTLDKYRGAVKDFEIAKIRALKLYPNDKAFHEYIQLCENHITGAIRFHVDEKRYKVKKIQIVVHA